ncbi:hypothetical protein ABRZ04_10480 [Castellaniella ginsengisoli]|uniref:DUF4760 domain-containing protein n=1 Tax=Castellaniella ginsengisoli TaxID=546114 RepID=A0AB39CXQ3_9BURK
MNEEKRYSEYSLYTFLAIGLAAGLVAGMAIYAAAYPAFQSNEWAAWAQAFFTVVGIGAAWRIMHRQHQLEIEDEARSRRLEKAAILEGVEGLTAGLHSQVLRINRIILEDSLDLDCSLGEALPGWRRDIEARAKVLATIPFHEVPYSLISVGLLRYLSEINFYLDDLIQLERDESEIRAELPEKRQDLANDKFSFLSRAYNTYIDVSHEHVDAFREHV